MKQILALIESVSPDDSTMLDEIDARVWCYLTRQNPEEITPFHDGSGQQELWKEYLRQQGNYRIFYTFDRNALKQIRPKGWTFSVQEIFDLEENIWQCTGKRFCYPHAVMAQNIKTEELAELHAILQALAFERGER